MSFILGLTGPTGSGKSSLKTKAEEFGFYVLDCDKTARKAAEKEECKEELRKAFGKDIFDEKGDLIRSLLAEKAFKTKEKTELLNRTIFPFITKLIKEEIKASGRTKILLDAPTLFESGMDSICGAVVAVLADKETRLKRIMSRDKIEKEAALIRLNAGKSDEFYKEKTPYVIYNNGEIDMLYKSFEDILNTIFGG